MAFVAEAYGRHYAPNTRETFRRQVLHQFVQARIVDYNPFEPDLPTNSPRAHYAISEAALEVVRQYHAETWDAAVSHFLSEYGSLLTIYQSRQSRSLVPVRLAEGIHLQLSPGQHNILQATIIEQFAPRFASKAQLLYLDDTAKKGLYLAADAFSALGARVSEHDKLPDIVLYDRKRNWLFLVEAVTAHGPMTPKRVMELKAMFGACSAGLIFVSAFPDVVEFRKHIREIAWETEVWMADMPDHLIHFNGDRFLGPRR